MLVVCKSPKIPNSILFVKIENYHGSDSEMRYRQFFWGKSLLPFWVRHEGVLHSYRLKPTLIQLLLRALLRIPVIRYYFLHRLTSKQCSAGLSCISISFNNLGIYGTLKTSEQRWKLFKTKKDIIICYVAIVAPTVLGMGKWFLLKCFKIKLYVCGVMSVCNGRWRY